MRALVLLLLLIVKLDMLLASDTNGIVFRCSSSKEAAKVKSEMRKMFTDFGWDSDVVESRYLDDERSEIEFKLSGDSTNTLNLKNQRNLHLADEELTIKTSRDRKAKINLVSEAEIVAAMLQNGRTHEFGSDQCNIKTLKDHVGIRRSVCLSVHESAWQFPEGEGAVYDTDYWDDDFELHRSRDLYKAVADAWDGEIGYKLGCRTATKMIFLRGHLRHYKETGQDHVIRGYERKVGRDPLSHVDPPWAEEWNPNYELWGKDSVFGQLHAWVPPEHWVPGDLGYLQNQEFSNPKNSLRKGQGEEGSNFIYTGGGKFEPYYRYSPARTLNGLIEKVLDWSDFGKRELKKISKKVGEVDDEEEREELEQSFYSDFYDYRRTGAYLWNVRKIPKVYTSDDESEQEWQRK